MKKTLLILLSFITLLSCCFLCGCSTNGNYFLSSIKYYDPVLNVTITLEIGDQIDGTQLDGMVLEKDLCILVVQDDCIAVRTKVENETEEVIVEVYEWIKGPENEYYGYKEDYGVAFIANVNGNKITIIHENDIAFIFKK